MKSDSGREHVRRMIGIFGSSYVMFAHSYSHKQSRVADCSGWWDHGPQGPDARLSVDCDARILR